MHRRTQHPIRGIAAALAIGLSVLGLASCGESSESAVTDPDSTGTYTVALITGSLPLADVTEDQKSFQGVDYDLLEAVSDAIGVNFKYVRTSFDNMIPGVSNGRYDLAAAGFYDTAEREASIDMVTYMSDGAVFVTHEGTRSPDGLTEDALCGLAVGVNSGGAQAARLPKTSQACVAAGKDPIELRVFPATSAAVLSLDSDRIDVYDISASIGLYVGSKRKDLSVGKPFLVVPVGFVLPKGSPSSDKIAKGMNKIIDNGTYAKILQEWGLDAAAIEKSEVNPKTQG